MIYTRLHYYIWVKRVFKFKWISNYTINTKEYLKQYAAWQNSVNPLVPDVH